MGKPYRPNMAGFSERLGLKNGIDELIKRPVPQQEILYYQDNDLIDAKPVSQYNNQYYNKKNLRSRRRKWRRR